MGKALGIDYGEKRIGLAITSEDRRFVFPYRTLDNGMDADAVLAQLNDICSRESVSDIVIGLPLDQHGQVGEAAAKVKSWGSRVAEVTGHDVIYEDERFSTTLAGDLQRQGGRSAKETRTSIDRTAAAVILQTYIDRNHG